MYAVNMFIAGVDIPTETEVEMIEQRVSGDSSSLPTSDPSSSPIFPESSLYYCDYLGMLHKLDFTAQGYASYFVLSIMDRYYRKDMSFDEGMELIRKCIAEVQKR